MKPLSSQLAFVRQQIMVYEKVWPKMPAGKGREKFEEHLVLYESIETSLMQLQNLINHTEGDQ